VKSDPIIAAAKAIIRAELDLFVAAHGRPRPVTICDLTSGYDAARRVLAQTRASSPSPGEEGSDG
jgi:hypothetical protein